MQIVDFPDFLKDDLDENDRIWDCGQLKYEYK